MKMHTWLLLTFVLCAQATSEARKVAALKKAEHAVNQSRKVCESAQSFAANSAAIKTIEQQLKPASDLAASHFRSRRAQLENKLQSLEEQAKKAVQVANSANDTSNITTYSSEIDAAVAKFQNISHELDALDAEQRKAVSKALIAIIHNVTEPAKNAAKQAKDVAHRAIDPLYSMGDAAEDHADRLNDAWVDAYNCAAAANAKVASLINDRAEKITDQENKPLQQASDGRGDAEKRLRTLADRVAARGAMFEAASLVGVEAQNGASSFGLLALLASGITGGMVVFIAMQFMSSTPAPQHMTTPLLHC